MFEKPSLMTRIIVGKTVGFVVGLIGFFLLPYFLVDAGWLLRWGLLFWYTTFGAIIAVFGVFDWHPVLKIKLPWWLFGPLLGAWLNFVLSLFAFDTMRALLIAVFGENGLLQSPFWFSAEGAVIGFVIAYLATRFGGEGPETAGK